MTNEKRLWDTVLKLREQKEIIGWYQFLDPTQPYLDFGVRKSPKQYIEAELKWYKSMSLSIDGIKNHAKLWEQVCDKDGMINSNYGWCIFSEENGNQFKNVISKLQSDSNTRQASMIYTRPSMHIDACKNGMKDFMCTHYTQHFIRANKLIYIVHQRSCDFIYGFFNDFAWHCYVYSEMQNILHKENASMLYIADSLHIYPKHEELLHKFDINFISNY